MSPEERTHVILIGEIIDPEVRRGRATHRRWVGYGDSYARCGQRGEILVANFDFMVTCERCRKAQHGGLPMGSDG